MIKFRFFKKGKSELATADTKKIQESKEKSLKTPLLPKRKNLLWKQ